MPVTRQMQNKIMKKLNFTNQFNYKFGNRSQQRNLNFQLSITEEFLQFKKALQTDTEIRK